LRYNIYISFAWLFQSFDEVLAIIHASMGQLGSSWNRCFKYIVSKSYYLLQILQNWQILTYIVEKLAKVFLLVKKFTASSSS